MKPVVWLRIAAVITLVHAVLHTIGGVFGGPPPGAEGLVDAMKTQQFEFMGAMRTFWMFNRGLGLAVSVFLTAESVVFWQLGAMAKAGTPGLRGVLWVFVAGYLGLAAVSSQYFFVGPVVTEIVIAACLAGAILTSDRERPESLSARA